MSCTTEISFNAKTVKKGTALKIANWFVKQINPIKCPSSNGETMNSNLYQKRHNESLKTRSCPDFRAFTRLSCVHVQTFVRSPDFRAFMFRLSCVHVQTFVRSCSDFRAFMSRLSWVRQTFVRSCSDFRAFFYVSRLCNFERTTPPSCVRLRSGNTCFRLEPQPGLHQILNFSLSKNKPLMHSTIFFAIIEDYQRIMELRTQHQKQLKPFPAVKSKRAAISSHFTYSSTKRSTPSVLTIVWKITTTALQKFISQSLILLLAGLFVTVNI